MTWVPSHSPVLFPGFPWRFTVSPSWVLTQLTQRSAFRTSCRISRSRDRALLSTSGADICKPFWRRSRMVEISKSGSSEGLDWDTGLGCSTPATRRPMPGATITNAFAGYPPALITPTRLAVSRWPYPISLILDVLVRLHILRQKKLLLFRNTLNLLFYFVKPVGRPSASQVFKELVFFRSI